MALRKKLRRIKRFAFLGALIGVTVGAKRARDQRSGGAAPLGPPAAWPPLQPAADVPVAAVGSLSTDADAVDDPATPATTTPPATTTAATISEATTSEAPTSEAPPSSSPGTGWVAPLDDGSCPLSHPIKANDNSQIFHEPGGRFYERTRAERCYADAASAEADGYRAAKGAGSAGSGGAS